MIRRNLVYEHVDSIRRATARLRRLSALEEAQFLADPDNYAIAEHHLRRALQAALDIGGHIVAKLGLGHPRDYRTILELLAQHGVLTGDFAGRIAGMAGYRNRLVHGYARVTPGEVYQLLATRLDDFDAFCEQILRYTEARST